ncbi:MAG TPA: NRDE family protein [Saprospiraceae bacterium]|nr:NRDE family protein [Saprospiraceae bacterium]HRK80807.1 NRDE family protein [Saprospiraceae bacterium]
MCTVTYLPKGPDHEWLLSSNRDEAPHRAAHGIQRRPGLLFPQDMGAGGTWIAAHEQGRAAVLLNGAFGLHQRRPPYRLSRGLMVLQYFEFADVAEFVQYFEFHGLEPFTFIIREPAGLYEIRWDEQHLHHKLLPSDEPHIWASATLYGPEPQQKRRRWFAEWLQKDALKDQQDVLRWHRHTGDGDAWNDLVMNRNGMVQTVSITSIAQRGNAMSMIFQDLLSGNEQQESMEM